MSERKYCKCTNKSEASTLPNFKADLGYDEIAVEDWSGETIDIPASYLRGHKKEEFFVLSVHGDSMYPIYMDGDKVLVLRQSTLNRSGEIGAVLYEGENATLKKV